MHIGYAGNPSGLKPNSELELQLVQAGSGVTVNMDKVDTSIDPLYEIYYTDMEVKLSDDKKSILFTGAPQKENPMKAAAGDSINSIAGANLLYGARYSAGMDDPRSVLYQTLGYVMANRESNPTEARRVISAVAGSTVTAIGAAQRDGMRRQLTRVRNHSNTLGLTPGYEYDELPYYHVWLEGTGAYSRLNTDGVESGYKHVAWGGSFGVDADVSERTSLGLSVTALYGNLDAQACDSASGHLDSYYLSGIMRTQAKRWGHTLVVAGGIDRAKLNRTVDYGTGSYRTNGTTNGWSFGATYATHQRVPAAAQCELRAFLHEGV